MAITLGSAVLSDAEVTDGIGFGDVAAAARLWVGHWPIALSAARIHVEPDEVPGLAAEALIGTIAAIAVGRGPREDLTAFVVAAVTELGEGEDPPAPSSTAPPPEIFTSAAMTRAFAGLPAADQEILRHGETEAPAQVAGTAARLDALTALQGDYLVEHVQAADSAACHQAHEAMTGAVAGGTSLSGATWVHMSECAWCTEAFHELAFTTTSLKALVDPGVFAPVVPAPADVVDVGDVLVAPAAIVPSLQEPGGHAAPAASRFGFLRARRTRLAAGALAAAAAITVGVLVVSGLDGPDGAPAAAQTGAGLSVPDQGSTALPNPFESVAPPSTDDPGTLTPGTATPTPTTPPAPAPAPTPTAGSSDPTPLPSATPRPSPTPTPTKATPQPSPTAPTATPTPTPTPTAAPCNALQRFFGLC